MNVLIVDDNLQSLEVLEKLLSGFGYNVIKAFNGKEAIQILNNEESIHLIISDILMPEMDGFALCRAVKTHPEWKRIPFIFYSATYTSKEDMEFAYSLGATKFIIKPMDPAKFIAEIQKIVHKEAELPENRQMQPMVTDEADYLREYNVRLIKKLEHKLEELEESEYRLSTILQYSLQAYAIFQDGYLIYMNDQLTSLTGYTSDEILSLDYNHLEKFIHKDDIDKVRNFLMNHDPYAEEFYDELRIIRKDGKIIWIEVRCAPIIMKNKPALQISARDITDRKANEKALIESEERLRSVLSSMEDLVFIIDEHLRFQDFFQPQKGTELYVKPEEFVGKRIDEVLPQDISEKMIQLFHQIKSTGKPVNFEYQLPIKGEVRWYNANASFLKKAAGEFGGIVIVSRDVTEQKQYEESIRKAKQEWERTFDAIGEIILIVDAKGTILNSNKAIERILELDREEAIGKKCFEVVCEAGTPCENCPILNTKMDKTGITEIQNKSKGRIFEETISHMGDEKEAKYVVFLRDVTEYRALQRQFLHAQKMEAIGKLAGGVAHDFNNILTVIEGYADLTRVKLNPTDPLYNRMVQIIDAAERGKRLTMQLLAFSKRQVLQPEIFNLNDLLHELLKMVQRLIGEDIKLVTNLDEELLDIEADYGQMEQVIINLAVNARDAMPNGGKLIIETQNMDVHQSAISDKAYLPPGQYVKLSISDTGIGMDKAVMEHIFEPFFTTKEEGKGTGLGLATVYGIVEQHGGKITVYSEPGKGTTFNIYLPGIESKRTERKMHHREAESDLYGDETVLIVEDEPLVRNLARDILEYYGYNVVEASNGGEALLACEKFRDVIHVVITDIIMPYLDGKQLSEKIKKIIPNVKVVFMSGYSPEIVFRDGIIERSDLYLQKPFLPQDLAGIVRKALDQKNV